jgi:hypothetical protein
MKSFIVFVEDDEIQEAKDQGLANGDTLTDEQALESACTINIKAYKGAIMTGAKAEKRFNDYAKSKGYAQKVVGDYAFTNRRGKIIKLLHSGETFMEVFIEGAGRRTIFNDEVPNEKR